jgi:hypothetical protein
LFVGLHEGGEYARRSRRRRHRLGCGNPFSRYQEPDENLRAFRDPSTVNTDRDPASHFNRNKSIFKIRFVPRGTLH